MVEGSGLAAVLVGLAGLEVVSAGEVGAELWVVVQSPQRQSAGWCSSCGVRAASHGRRVVRLRDVPCGGRPAVVVWRKRLWRCREPLCPRRTWSETHPGLPSRRVLTARAAEEIAAWLSAAVPVATVAARFGVAWGTAWAAFTSRAVPAVAAAHEELPPPAALGVDETTFLRSGRRRFGDRWCTSIVDLSEGRLLDVVPGRSGGVIRGWVADRETRDPGWAARVSATVCDPLRAYARGLRTALPDAALVIDAYHVTRLGLDTLDEVRQHLSRELLPRRPRKGDVLYDCRRRLRTAPERLTAQTLARLRAAVNRADPSGAVWLAWRLAHELRRLGQVATGRGARRRLNKIIAEAAAARRPELRRLAATLTEWRDPICARFDNGRVTNAATEAINTLIKKIKRIGHGYRNFTNYRLRLLITWGKITVDKTVTPIGLRPHTTLP